MVRVCIVPIEKELNVARIHGRWRLGLMEASIRLPKRVAGHGLDLPQSKWQHCLPICTIAVIKKDVDMVLFSIFQHVHLSWICRILVSPGVDPADTWILVVNVDSMWTKAESPSRRATASAKGWGFPCTPVRKARWPRHWLGFIWVNSSLRAPSFGDVH